MKTARTILQDRSRAGGPLRVALIGAGPLSRAIAAQVAADLPNVTLVAVADGAIAAARDLIAEAGLRIPRVIDSAFGLQAAIRWGEPAVTRNWRVLCESPLIDAVVEATGDPELGAEVVRTAAGLGKHVIPTTRPQDREPARGAATARIELVRMEVDAAKLPDILGIGGNSAPAGKPEAAPQNPAARA